MGRVPDAPIRLVIVDDDALVRGGLATILGLEPDLEVVGQAAEGAEAVAVCRELAPDVVLMDVRMPEVDGIEATRRIRAELAKDRQPRVIALTANAMTEDRKTCEAAGMDDFLSKPVTAKELERALRGAKGRTPPARDSALGTREIDALRRLTEGSPEIMRAIIDEFLGMAGRAIAEMQDALERGDAKALERAAHTLKGSSGQMGAQQLMFECAAIERAAAAGDMKAVRDRLPLLHKKHEGARAKLAALRDAVVI